MKVPDMMQRNRIVWFVFAGVVAGASAQSCTSNDVEYWRNQGGYFENEDMLLECGIEG